MLDAQSSPQAILLKDYAPPRFLIPQVDLQFDLDPQATMVKSQLQVTRNGQHDAPLVLDGHDLELVGVRLNGQEIGPQAYKRDAVSLSIPINGDRAQIEIITRINPAANTQLMGLYVSGGNFCSQCEAEGFRRITYFTDRPDVMSQYSVTLRADRTLAPVLLANGNPAGQGVLDDGRHWARWDDPHPKPCYLFALVAGNLTALTDRFTTASGRAVTLNIWVREADLDRCGHAMDALKKSMLWDEQVFGREYDLDVYNIVAVGDFNFGAMENKGLNIFNSRYVLAKPETATDQDFDAVESVIAHEYFHNWTGNRVTCRDWFQLSLKEGLTVFRDQEFSADMGSRGLKRIEDVRMLRAGQFPEDAGPLAHPIRPDSYIEISNFYTATIYNKGAEVIRMMHTLLGADLFRAGMDLYFQRHDGQAVTCDDFANAMADASGIDLEQFRLWYVQAGTPQLHAAISYDAATREARLILRQSIPTTPGQPVKKPMHIPVRVALFGADSGNRLMDERLIELTAEQMIISFPNMPERPVPSLLRGFSAPVVLHSNLSREDQALLARVDDDPFARVEASQQLALSVMLEAIDAQAAQAESGGRNEIALNPLLRDVIAAALSASAADPALAAEAALLPSEAYIGDQMKVMAVDAIHAVRQSFRRALARDLRDAWLAAYHDNNDAQYTFTAQAKARRKLKNIALQYLMADDDPEATDLAFRQFSAADNMTDQIAALAALANSTAAQRDETLERFYSRWQDDALVIDKWFGIQALSTRADTLDVVAQLCRHPAFTLTNPNRLRSVVGSFSVNQVRFHDATGGGYRFLADQVLAVDALNSQTAARLVAPLGRWRRVDEVRAALMRAELERVLGKPGLSKDVYEMASKSMG